MESEKPVVATIEGVPLSIDPIEARDSDVSDLNGIVSRVGYFSVYGGFSAVKPFYIILLAEKGFTEVSCGWILALFPFISVVEIPLLSYLVDTLHCGSTVTVIGVLMTIISFFAVLGLSKAHPILIVFFFTLHFIGSCPLLSFYDSRVLSTLTASEKTHWGSIRSFGSVGWGVVAALSFGLTGKLGWGFSAFVLSTGLGVALVCYFKAVPVSPPPPASTNFLSVLGYAVKKKRIALLLTTAAVSGVAYSLSATFLPKYLESLGASSFLIGLSVTMTVVIEIPLFLQAKWIHERFEEREMVSLSLLAWSLRGIGYSFLSNPYFVLLLEPLHGFSFGFMWLAGVRFVSREFPPTLSQSAIGFLSVAAFGVGPILGNVLGGVMYKHLGPRTMYFLAAVVIAIASVSFFLLDKKIEKSMQNQQSEDDSSSVVIEN